MGIYPESGLFVCGRTHDKHIYGCRDIRFHITRFPSRQVSYIVFREPGDGVITCDKSPGRAPVAGPNAPGAAGNAGGAQSRTCMADMVRAVVQTGPRQMEMREYPRPVIGPDDGALLRVEACGICGSDVEQYKGAMGTRGLPMIPGHEPLGVIEEIAESASRRWGVSAGDRVAVEIMIPCRSCDRCLAGRYMNCKNRIGSHGGGNPPERQGRLTGGYAEYIDLHPNSIVHPMRGD